MKLFNFTVLLAVTASLTFSTMGRTQEATPVEAASKPNHSSFDLLGPPPSDGPMVVQASFFLQDIDDIDDEAETFEFTGTLVTKWKDPRQAFDSGQAGVAEKIYQGDFQFNELAPSWCPQIVLVNVSGSYEKHGVLLRVDPDGSNTLVEKVKAVAEADLNLRRFPFDRQRLEAKFEILGFDRSEVVFEVRSSPSGFDTNRIQIPGWTLNRVAVSAGEYSATHAGKLGIASTFVPFDHLPVF